MPTYQRAFPVHSKPWLAKITAWPDNSPPAMAFGKRVKGAAAPTVTIEVSENDLVRWGAKDENGTPRPDLAGFGIWQQGKIWPVTKEEAQAQRRLHHPEDASAAPIRGTFGRARRPPSGAPGAAAPTPPAASAGPSQTVTMDATALAHVVAHLKALVLASDHLADVVAHLGPLLRPLQEAIAAITDLIPGARAALGVTPAPVPAPPAAARFKPEAAPDEPEAPDSDEIEEPPAPIPVDKDGLPLF